MAKGIVGLGYRDFRGRIERRGRNARPALFFDWGFWGVLTKNIILYYDLRIYYFFKYNAGENIENIFIFFAFFSTLSGRKITTYQIKERPPLDKKQTINYIKNKRLQGCNSITNYNKEKDYEKRH